MLSVAVRDALQDGDCFHPLTILSLQDTARVTHTSMYSYSQESCTCEIACSLGSLVSAHANVDVQHAPARLCILYEALCGIKQESSHSGANDKPVILRCPHTCIYLYRQHIQCCIYVTWTGHLVCFSQMVVKIEC